MSYMFEPEDCKSSEVNELDAGCPINFVLSVVSVITEIAVSLSSLTAPRIDGYNSSVDCNQEG